jgi:hypothetical protein
LVEFLSVFTIIYPVARGIILTHSWVMQFIKWKKKYHLFPDYWRGRIREKLQFIVLISTAWHASCFHGNSKGLKIQDITNSYNPSPCNSTQLCSTES